ncbi:MAG: hypothetical protein FWD64_14295 [Acidobacteriaceae bacterium]|nr:hypothetical protein [Acidobacteriaceae bacterium]
MENRNGKRLKKVLSPMVMAALTLVLLGAGSAFAQYSVPPAGDDKNPGTLAAPFLLSGVSSASR